MEDAKTDQNQKQVEVDGNSPWPYVAQGRILNAGRGWVWIQSAFSVFMRSPINWMLMALVHLASLILAANVVAFALRSIVSVWAGDNWRFFAHEFPPWHFWRFLLPFFRTQLSHLDILLHAARWREAKKLNFDILLMGYEPSRKHC